jgi:hypothetical protein
VCFRVYPRGAIGLPSGSLPAFSLVYAEHT